MPGHMGEAVYGTYTPPRHYTQRLIRIKQYITFIIYRYCDKSKVTDFISFDYRTLHTTKSVQRSGFQYRVSIKSINSSNY